MRQVLKRPYLSEKSSQLAEAGKYVFEVLADANKIEIRRAVETRYGVGVANVNTVTIRPKQRTRYTRKGFMIGKTAWRKKAIVTVKPGQTIDLVGAE